MKSRLTPDRAVALGMLFFLVCATIWALRVPIEHGVPISFNPDEPSHFLVVRYIAQHWQLPPYTRDYYESAHPPLSDFIQAVYVHLWPTALWVYALRFLSTAFGLCTLFVIYKTCKLVVSPWTAATATCLIAALPMFITFNSSVTNDSLSVLLASSILYVLVRGLRDGMSNKPLNLLCLLVGLAGIAKYTLLGLLPIAIIVVIFTRRREGKPWTVPAASIVATFVLVSGWWYLRNQILYGDPFRAKAEAAMAMFTGGGAPTLPSFWSRVFVTLCGSFLGLYPSFPNWPLAIYDVLVSIVAFVVIAGFIVILRRGMSPIKLTLGAFGVSVLAVVLYYQLNHFEPHSRLLFPAATCIALFLVSLRHAIPFNRQVTFGALAIVLLACLSLALVLSPI